MFSSLGIESISLPLAALAITTLIEISAFILVSAALFYLLWQNDGKARNFFFWGTFAGLALFGFFILGDQIFGDRSEVLEHSIFWALLLVSLGGVYLLARTGRWGKRTARIFQRVFEFRGTGQFSPPAEI